MVIPFLFAIAVVGSFIYYLSLHTAYIPYAIAYAVVFTILSRLSGILAAIFCVIVGLAIWNIDNVLSIYSFMFALGAIINIAIY